jgi:hypothetical protein
MTHHCRMLAGLAALVFFHAPAVQAAQSYDNCTGFIDALPATISTQGTWCLRHDLTTAVTAGAAITIATNNVTVDCNDFKVGGLAAGPSTQVTVRHCSLRGFYRGIYLTGSTLDNTGGHLVENNRLDNNTRTGIRVDGEGSIVRGNVVRDTGGSTAARGIAYAINTVGNVDIHDNTVSGVAPLADGTGSAISFGIRVDGSTGGSIEHNRVRGLTSLGTGNASAIATFTGFYNSLRDNHVIGPGDAGLSCNGAMESAKGNNVFDFTNSMPGCDDDGGNTIL